MPTPVFCRFLTTSIKSALVLGLTEFDAFSRGDLRQKVLSLVPAWKTMSLLGSALMPREIAKSARGRILYYFRKYPRIIISRDELAIVSGISEWARRVRELRVEFGWSIISGIAARQMQAEDELPISEGYPDCSGMGPDNYIMFDNRQDTEAAHRWNIAKDIRGSAGGSQIKILAYLRQNVGKPVTGEELRYVAKEASEWARRTRELRTEKGWQISTYWNGRPDLPVGQYLLESAGQLPAHDRVIPDDVRRKVLIRDGYACVDCGWDRKQWTTDDPRHLELHHVKAHVEGGGNQEGNLATLCNVCHDGK